MFKTANNVDDKNISPIVNIGCILFEEQSDYENAAIKFLDALSIKPDDEEALCNLALALKKTSYIDYAEMAFEEAIKVNPSNTFILSNYMYFLLEHVKLDQFKKVLTLAKNVLDDEDFGQMSKLGADYTEAIEGTAHLEESEEPKSSSPGGSSDLFNRLQARSKKPKGPSKPNPPLEMHAIDEEDDEV